MTLRLTVDEAAWRAHVAEITASTPALVPVVKGNGYGFGRDILNGVAAEFSDVVAVGTMHEVDASTASFDTVVVLTPSVDVPDDLPASTVPTVGKPAHLEALRRIGWRGRVGIKLESSMHRYGIAPEELDDLTAAVAAAGLEVREYLVHPPLLGGVRDEQTTVDEIEAWLPFLDPAVPLSLSHLTRPTYGELVERYSDRTLRLRVGTMLWHGDKSFLHLGADVLDIRQLGRSSSAGYRLMRINDRCSLVMIGAGSAHGVAPLADGHSPFHFAGQRLTLLEPPHMHTSMALVGIHQQCPEIGDRVDVQRPLTTTWVDQVVWT